MLFKGAESLNNTFVPVSIIIVFSSEVLLNDQLSLPFIIPLDTFFSAPHTPSFSIILSRTSPTFSSCTGDKIVSLSSIYGSYGVTTVPSSIWMLDHCSLVNPSFTSLWKPITFSPRSLYTNSNFVVLLEASKEP